jgi:hypothetical protein
MQRSLAWGICLLPVFNSLFMECTTWNIIFKCSCHMRHEPMTIGLFGVFGRCSTRQHCTISSMHLHRMFG